ncbi:unnamed protein product [Protopolystoma xenopodis]|uniref:Uncharacterized protein n=1 Tax=Protopolystoma xenopodis TaxID=117903 RepID=A0A448WVP0_9PLAT|nr:unnamed protein product [Protopolystoma xenopodis]
MIDFSDSSNLAPYLLTATLTPADSVVTNGLGSKTYNHDISNASGNGNNSLSHCPNIARFWHTDYHALLTELRLIYRHQFNQIFGISIGADDETFDGAADDDEDDPDGSGSMEWTAAATSSASGRTTVLTGSGAEQGGRSTGY